MKVTQQEVRVWHICRTCWRKTFTLLIWWENHSFKHLLSYFRFSKEFNHLLLQFFLHVVLKELFLSRQLSIQTQISPQNLAYNGLRSKGLSCLVDAMESNDTLEKLNISGILQWLLYPFEYYASISRFLNIYFVNKLLLFREWLWRKRRGSYTQFDRGLCSFKLFEIPHCDFICSKIVSSFHMFFCSKGNESIKELNLSHNKFREEGGKQIGISLGMCIFSSSILEFF